MFDIRVYMVREQIFGDIALFLFYLKIKLELSIIYAVHLLLVKFTSYSTENAISILTFHSLFFFLHKNTVNIETRIYVWQSLEKKILKKTLVKKSQFS